MEDTRRRGNERRFREEEDAGKARFAADRGNDSRQGRYRRMSGLDSDSSDVEARSRVNRRASERDEREKDKDKDRERARSYSSDFEARRRDNRRGGGRDEREKDGERWTGSERREREQVEPRRWLEEEEYGSIKRSDEKIHSGSSDEDIDKKRSEKKQPRKRIDDSENNGRWEDDSDSSGEETDKKRSEGREKEQPRKRRDDREMNGRREEGSESSGEERDRKRSEKQEQEQPRKRRDDREKNCNREDGSESSGEERDMKRSEKQELEKTRKRRDEEEAGDGKRRDDRERNGRQGSDSESSDQEKDKRSKRWEKEQHRKRMDDKNEDEKEALYERRHVKRRDERNSRSGRRGTDSESSDGEDRRRDRERRIREKERRRHRYDYDDSSDSSGRRKRHSRRRSDHREDRTRSQRRDLEDGEIGSRRERNKKASESKQEGKDGKGEEVVVRPQTQFTIPNLNPSGDLGTLGRTGGVYIPPFKLARMMKEIEDKSSPEYQRLTWDALRKSINGLVNKVNATNIKNIIPELLGENLIRGRGLFCRSCMKSQMASPGFTDVFAALVAVVNTKFPEIGDLLLRRIILQLKRAYKRNDKPQLMAAVKFIAHLVNQQVAHELVALELLTILLEQPTDDSVEVAVDFVKECGSILQDLCPKGLHGIFERFRGILHEGEIDKRVQFLIEGLFAIRKAKFQGHPAVRPELDLVDPEDQLTHEMSLEDEIDPETGLDIFKQDPNFLENEKRYEELKKSILGDESEDEEGSDAESDDDEDDEEEDEDEDEQQMQIKDETETNLINLRRTIYLTIMSSVDFEEAGHKLLKIKLEPGQEMELNIMLLECCSQERTYLRYYGLLGQRFCMLNKVYQENFDKCFVQQYSMIHRLETNKLRNVAKFFAHLLGTDALPWHVLAYIRLTEEDTTSSSRIFIKILFQELSEHLGIRLLNERLNDPAMQDSFDSIFPKDNPRNTRFAINFFTSIGLGGITENLREYLKNMPRMIMQQQKPESDDESGSGPSGSSSSGSESSSAESDSSSDSSSSSSDESDRDRRRKRKKDESGGGRHRKRRKGD